jgi:phthiodiolone/phenolphthiodiolone dimycocerosates ketoreductase
MLDITGRFADGWWPAGAWTPEEYGAKLKVIRQAAEKAGRDPMAITPATTNFCLIGDDAELAEILEAPLVKALVMQIPAEVLRERGHVHPLGEDWRGMQDIDPAKFPRERILDMLARTRPEHILSVVEHGSPQQIAAKYKGYVDAGMRVAKLLDYSGMAGLKFAASSAEKVRQAEDELMRLTGGAA